MSDVGNYRAGSPEAQALNANPSGPVTIGNTTFGAQTKPGAGGRPDGELLVKAAGMTFTSWQSVNVSCSVLQIPRSFRIGGTVRYPNSLRTPIPINSPVQILIGGKPVLTGYLEQGTNRIGPEEHVLDLVGRGRCCDLVDCSAILEGMGENIVSIGSFARLLVAPYAGPIKVLTPDGDGDGKAYYFQINISESPYEIIERIARYEGLLVYENADGNLVLSRNGKTSHSSGFTEGVNIQAIDRFDSRDQRFSRYVPALMSSDAMGTRTGQNANSAGNTTFDPGITRERPKIVISEQVNAGEHLAEQRAAWEAALRIGQSFRVDLTCDSWLDSAGTPWTPNMLAPLSMPSLDLSAPDLVIVAVTFLRDAQRGTTARVTLMPSQALTVEPLQMQGFGQRLLTDAPVPPGPLGPATPVVPPVTAPNASVGKTSTVRLYPSEPL